ncbi:MAG: DUF2796 domain-containing protein [Alcanivoracaceae bacterium]|jgi:hypothetical protein|nr:DUF2796 domain-containing protein [Alcanivoracaceae bacterium]
MTSGRWLILCLLLLAPWLQAQSVHVHGQGELQVSSQGDQLGVLLTLPAMDVVGFEHAPSSAAQQAAVSQAAEKLGNPQSIMIADAAAACVVQSVKVDSALLVPHEKAHSHDHGHDHADFTVEYQFSCGKPQLLTQLKLLLFQWLPELQLRTQMVTEHGAQVTTLHRDSSVLLLPSAP